MTTIFGKIWGSTQPLEVNPYFEFHRAEVKAGYQCSKHLHRYRWNGFYVESGILEIHVWKSDYDLVDITILNPGDYTKVAPGEKHLFVCQKDAVLFELYWTELNPNDIVRDNVGGTI